jgi:hypothetical protein
MNTLIDNELFRFVVQVVTIAIGIAAAYYKIQNNIALIKQDIANMCDRVHLIEEDRIKRWCTYEAVAGEQSKILSKMATDIEVIKTKIEIYLKGNKI